MAIIESAGITDIGQKRNANEDAMLIADSMGLYVVADGMGGHQAGEVASKLVVDTMRHYFQTLHKTSKAASCEEIDRSLSQEANRLLASIHLSNQAVHRALDEMRQYLARIEILYGQLPGCMAMEMVVAVYGVNCRDHFCLSTGNPAGNKWFSGVRDIYCYNPIILAFVQISHCQNDPALL